MGLPRVTINSARNGFVANGRTFVPWGMHSGIDLNGTVDATALQFDKLVSMGINVWATTPYPNKPEVIDGYTAAAVIDPTAQAKLADIFDAADSRGLYIHTGGLSLPSAMTLGNVPDDWLTLTESERWNLFGLYLQGVSEVTENRTNIFGLSIAGETLTSDTGNDNDFLNGHNICNDYTDPVSSLERTPTEIIDQFLGVMLPYNADPDVFTTASLFDFSEFGTATTFEIGVAYGNNPGIDVMDAHAFTQSSVEVDLNDLHYWGSFGKPLITMQVSSGAEGLYFRQYRQEMARGQYQRDAPAWGWACHYNSKTFEELAVTTTTSTAAISDTSVTVDDPSLLTAGMLLYYDASPNAEIPVIDTIVGSTVNFTAPLAKNHASGVVIGKWLNDVIDYDSYKGKIDVYPLLAPTVVGEETAVQYLMPERVTSSDWTLVGSDAEDQLDALVGNGEVSPTSPTDDSGVTITDIGQSISIQFQPPVLSEGPATNLDFEFHIDEAVTIDHALNVTIFGNGIQIVTEAFTAEDGTGWKTLSFPAPETGQNTLVAVMSYV